MENKSYSDMYELYRSKGVSPAIFFMPKDIGPEEYRYIEGKHVTNIQEERYMVSNYGNIIDLNRGLSPVYLDQEGYSICYLMRNDGTAINKKLHRMVMMVFNPNPNFAHLQVNHMDGNPSNNMLYNLEWTSGKENSDHAMLRGLHKMSGEDNPNGKLTREQVNEICALIETGKYYDTEIAKMYNVSYTNISDIHKGKIWTDVGRNYDLSKRKSRSKK